MVKLLLQHISEADPNYSSIRSETLNLFDDELQSFMDKTGIYGNRPHIHESRDILENRTYRWHAQHSRHTKCLGQVACRVTSKPMGQSASERNCATVDRVASDKRGRLRTARMSKQSMLVGNYAALLSEGKKKRQTVDEKFTNSITDNDFYKVRSLQEFQGCPLSLHFLNHLLFVVWFWALWS